MCSRSVGRSEKSGVVTMAGYQEPILDESTNQTPVKAEEVSESEQVFVEGDMAGPNSEDQRTFLLKVLYGKVRGATLNWKTASDNEAWDGVEFNSNGMITSLILPNCKINLKFDKLMPLFSKYLQVLDLSGNKLRGVTSYGIAVPLTSLTHFNVSGNENLAGEICEYLSKSNKLIEFSVARTKLFGNLFDLDACKDLTIINVGNTEVAGNLNHLEEMTKLTHVCCDFSQVTGDISSAANWPELKTIYLNGKQITGDLSVFAKSCPKLNEIWLTKSNVVGDLSSVTKCKDLTLLDVYGTQVGGDIAVLKECPQLQSLYLSYSFAVGDIASLKENPELTHILLDYSYVTGNVSAFLSNKKVEKIGLAYTQCVGYLPIFSECIQLRFLNVYGIRGFEDNPDPKGPKPIKILRRDLRKNKKLEKLKHVTKIRI